MPKSEAILKLVRHLRWSLLLIAAAGVPSCLVYDQGLLDTIDGEDNVTASGGSSGTGGSGGNVDGGTGGEVATGASAGTGGGGDSGGTGGMGGDMPTGGDGGTGGNATTGGTGGGTQPECVDAPPGEFTGLGATTELDNFDIDWPKLSSEVTAWNAKGYWSGAGESAAVTESLTPKGDSAEWEAGKGYIESCEAGNNALNIHATGSTEWGVSFAAQFNAGKTDVDLSDYDGVVFWARSENKSILKVAYATAADPLIDIGTTQVPPLTTTWTQRKMPFPTVAAFDPLEVALIKFVGVPPNGEETIDIWIDNVTFYANP